MNRYWTFRLGDWLTVRFKWIAATRSLYIELRVGGVEPIPF